MQSLAADTKMTILKEVNARAVWKALYRQTEAKPPRYSHPASWKRHIVHTTCHANFKLRRKVNENYARTHCLKATTKLIDYCSVCMFIKYAAALFILGLQLDEMLFWRSRLSSFAF